MGKYQLSTHFQNPLKWARESNCICVGEYVKVKNIGIRLRY